MFHAYYIWEMVAALVLFSALFAMVSVSVLVFVALDRVCQRTFAYAGGSAVWLFRRATRSGAAIIETSRKT